MLPEPRATRAAAQRVRDPSFGLRIYIPQVLAELTPIRQANSDLASNRDSVPI